MVDGVGKSFIEGLKQAGEARTRQQQNALSDLVLEQRRQDIQTGRHQQGISQEMAKLRFINNAAKALKRVPENQWLESFDKLRPLGARVGVDFNQFDVNQLTHENIDNIIATTDTFLSDPSKLSAAQRELQDDMQILQGAVDEKGQLKPVDQLTTEQRAIAIKRRLLPGAVGSALQTITERGTVKDIAQTEETIAGAKERGKLEQQLKFKPEIQEAIKQAEAQGAAKGEAFVDHARAVAALPGIEEVVGKLKVLADDATFTLGGKAFNEISKQLGISTSGDTSRASMISIVDNQVLPLLRPIFGAAFTAAEGDRLRNSLLDPDSTSESRKAQLDAFLDQMKRNIETKQRESEIFQRQQRSPDDPGVIMIDANGNRARVFKDGSFEEL